MGKASELALELQEKEWLSMDITTKAFIRIRKELDAEEYFVKRVEPKGFDYHGLGQWDKKKEIANKGYKDLKQEEFEIRQKINEEAKKESTEGDG